MSNSAEAAFTDRSTAFLSGLSTSRIGVSPEATAERVETLVREHDAWREGACLNLNAAESLLSRRCRRILDSDMATRLTEGLPGDKLYPPPRQNRFVDEIEGMILDMAARQFGTRLIEWRSPSTSMANAAVFFATLQPGDVALVQGDDNGGNYAYNAHGPIKLTGAQLAIIPPSGEAFEFDLDAMAGQARRLRPKLIVVGGSHVLFPYPLRRMREIADEVGAVLMYDAAHLGLLISAGTFQRPLEEGAHVVTISTHKIMGGPVGGMVMCADEALLKRILAITFPGLIQTRDVNKYSALAIALAETEKHGPRLAARMVGNAQALAGALEARGFRVLEARRGYTATHQIFVKLGRDAEAFEQRCQAAGILLAQCVLVGDRPGVRSGSRIATHEVTRLGMGPEEMGEIAGLIAGAAHGDDVSAKVEALVRWFPDIVYSLDAAAAA